MTLTCRINDRPTAIGASEGGTRDDPAITRQISVTVQRVTVAKVQWRDPSDAASVYQDVGSEPLTVLKGSRLIFKAIPNPSGAAWPDGQPTWSGEATGSGETTDVTFDTISASSSDYRTVTAHCVNSVTVNVLVYELTLVTTPQDNFSGRSQSSYGVGEPVNLSIATAPASVASTLSSGSTEFSLVGLGILVDNSDGTGTFTAGPFSGSVELKVHLLSGPSRGEERSASRTVVEPDNNTYMVPQAGVAHDQDTASVGFVGDIYLTPKDVSFHYILFTEGEGTSTATGWLEPDFNNVHHPATGGYVGAQWYYVGNGNIQSGSKVTFPLGLGDQVGFGSYPRLPPAAPYGDGTFTLPIDWWYAHVNRQTLLQTPKKFMVATQSASTDSTGRATIQKARSGPVSANASDPTTKPAGFPNFPYPPQR